MQTVLMKPEPQPPRLDQDDERWAAVLHRDPARDGQFWFSVRTTGVYCRPACAARTPRRENVAFHESRAAAEAAGFRPCKRCRPDEPPLAERHALRIAEACRLIETSEAEPSLDALARAAGLSRHHFHRLFKAATGLTPKAYAAGVRGGRVRGALRAGASVTEAIYDAGFNSSGRFYAQSAGELGMTPSQARKGGQGLSIRYAFGKSSLGQVLAAATDKGVCAITLGDDRDALVADLKDRFPGAEIAPGDAGFEQTVAKVVALVERPEVGLDLPLDVRGTAFQQRVWRALRDIPAGETASYTEVAARIGAPQSVRAVAGACAANHLAVAIPCHRVLRGDGSISGYRWGVERKRALLKRERGG